METRRSHEVANSEDLCVSRLRCIWEVQPRALAPRYTVEKVNQFPFWLSSQMMGLGCISYLSVTAHNSVTFLVPKLSAASCVSGIGKTWSVWSSLQPCTWQQCKLRMAQKPPEPLGFLSLDCDVERLRRKPYSRKGCRAQTGTQLPVLFFLFLSWHMQGFTASTLFLRRCWRDTRHLEIKMH